MPREGSFALAGFGRVRKVQEPAFEVASGRRSFAVNRILEVLLVISSVCLVWLLDAARFTCSMKEKLTEAPCAGGSPTDLLRSS
jgi:hypothetical protein